MCYRIFRLMVAIGVVLSSGALSANRVGARVDRSASANGLAVVSPFIGSLGVLAGASSVPLPPPNPQAASPTKVFLPFTSGGSRALSLKVRAIVAGGLQACVVMSGGGVKCWGENDHGQLGDGTRELSNVPVDVVGLDWHVVQVAVGRQHVCALTSRGGVKCWGRNDIGQVGDGTIVDRTTPVAVIGLASGVRSITAGGYHTCAVMDTGGVKCWGYNGNGQLGDGTLGNKVTPADVSGLSAGVVSVAGGDLHTCAVTTGGGAKCWGDNSEGQVGDGTMLTRTLPVDVSGLTSGVRVMALGWRHTCAVTSGGGMKCWGRQYHGQLGNGTLYNPVGQTTPVDVIGLGGPVTAAAAGFGTTCALTSGGGVKCWGYGEAGTLGDGRTSISPTPVDVSGLGSGVTAISMMSESTCALTNVGGVKCWGYGLAGNLGNGVGPVVVESVPVDVSGLGSVVSATVVGGLQACVVMSGGGVRCWGGNEFGQLGDGTTITRTVPGDVKGLDGHVVAVAAGRYHVCALTSRGGVKCWGRNDSGQVGDGTTISRALPVDVVGLASGVRAITAGGYHTCAVLDGGGVKCWGDNDYGQLGDGTQVDKVTPANVTGLSAGVAAVVGGDRHTCAVTSLGGAKCWGANEAGQVGDGTTVDKLTPVDVSGLTSGVRQMALGWRHTCAVTSGGGMKCWGSQYYAQLGNEVWNLANQTTPVDVVVLGEPVTAAATSYGTTCALTSGGGVKCWGYGGVGNLGNGRIEISPTAVDVIGLGSGVTALSAMWDFICAQTVGGGVRCWGGNYGGLGTGIGPAMYETVPVDVSGLGSVVTATVAGRMQACVVMSGGGVRCWGDNAYGQLGDGTHELSNVPVDVVGLDWRVVQVAVGGYHVCALTSRGGVKCWGRNDDGQVGDGTTISRTMPVDVSGLGSGVRAITAGTYHTCAVLDTGGVKCWGANAFGQLGDGTQVDKVTPADVMGLSAGVGSVVGGDRHTCAVTTSGGAKCWGYNSDGQVGDGSTLTRTVPVDVSGLTSGVRQMALGGRHTCAVTSGGGMKCWGSQSYGQLGNGVWNEQVDQTTPVTVVGLGALVTAATASEWTTCALTSGGGVKCWGYGGGGNLGNGQIVISPTPVDVIGLGSGVTTISAQWEFACALTNVGGVKCWGVNYATLGNGVGPGTYESIPVDVSGLGRLAE